jgi:hypothetical protein
MTDAGTPGHALLPEPCDAQEAKALRYYPDWLTMAQVYSAPVAVPSVFSVPERVEDVDIEPPPLPWLPATAIKRSE